MDEISRFLEVDGRLDLQVGAVETLLSITGTQEGRDLIIGHPDVVRQLILLTQVDQSRAVVAKDAALSLINLSADEQAARILLDISDSTEARSSDERTCDLVDACVRHVLNKESTIADPCAMILSNLTRPSVLVERVVEHMKDYNWEKIVHAFAFAHNYNTKGAKLHYLGPLLSNLTQSEVFRKMLMNREHPMIQTLLPFTEYQESIVRRGGVVGAIKNCSFDHEQHQWLLSDDVDILPHILLPLAGPEEFDDEDNEKLPVDLQYLPETKERESDPDIRIMLLETLCQLCATRETREILRSKNTYVILREYHKWEKEKAALLACENVIDILIRTEVEIGMDNLKLVDVPEDYTDKFKKMDEDFLKDD